MRSVNKWNYYLKTNAENFGVVKSINPNEKMTMVFDAAQKTIHTFMANNSQKFRFSAAFDMPEIADAAVDQHNLEITMLPNKTIKGYNCQGYKIEGVSDSGVHINTSTWIYKHPSVSFTMGMGLNNNTISPDQLGYLENMEGIVMEMNINTYELRNNGRKKNEHKAIIECLSIEPKSFVINTSDYPSMLE